MDSFVYEYVKLLNNKVDNIDPNIDKNKLIDILKENFHLVKKRSVYTCDYFSIRVCSSKDNSFSNTVLSLSTLLKYDDKPFIVILDTPDEIVQFLANTTFLKKISHSSHELRVDNIKGSFNGSDIIKNFDGIENKPENFVKLFSIHSAFSTKENIERLVEATNNITPKKPKFNVTIENRKAILESPYRTLRFIESPYYENLIHDLKKRTLRHKEAIITAAFIDNVNIRGRLIEELICTDDPRVAKSLVDKIEKGELLSGSTDQKLGDYNKEFAHFHTATDIKTKILFLQSEPKAYNVDKLLEYLSQKDTVYFFFFVGIDSNSEIKMKLVSVFNSKLLDATRTRFHWAGRNSRGVTQFDGNKLKEIIELKDDSIDIDKAVEFLNKLIDI